MTVLNPRAVYTPIQRLQYSVDILNNTLAKEYDAKDVSEDYLKDLVDHGDWTERPVILARVALFEHKDPDRLVIAGKMHRLVCTAYQNMGSEPTYEWDVWMYAGKLERYLHLQPHLNDTSLLSDGAQMLTRMSGLMLATYQQLDSGLPRLMVGREAMTLATINP